MCHVDYVYPIATTTLSTKTTLGTCSRCGGRVVIPGYWLGINPPDPTCERCGAVKYGPVIDMGPPPACVPVYPIYPVQHPTPVPYKRTVREGNWK